MTPRNHAGTNLDQHDGDLLSAEEIGALIGCSSRTVRRYASSGKLPPGIAVGKFRRWHRRVIDLALAEKVLAR